MALWDRFVLGLVAPLVTPFGCATQVPRDPVEIDCDDVDERYEFSVLQPFNEGQTPSWFGVTDATPGATIGVDNPMTCLIEHNPVIEPIDDVPERGEDEPGRCGNTHAVVFRASGYRDWGAFFAEYATAEQNVSGEGFDGISFWARTGERSDRSFTLAIDNAKTALVSSTEPELNECVPELEFDAGTNCEGDFEVATQGEYPEGTAPEEACGNPFTAIINTTTEWQLFTIPWEDFYQLPQANRQPNGLDPEVRLVRFTIRFTTETNMELWLDDLGLYVER